MYSLHRGRRTWMYAKRGRLIMPNRTGPNEKINILLRSLSFTASGTSLICSIGSELLDICWIELAEGVSSGLSFFGASLGFSTCIHETSILAVQGYRFSCSEVVRSMVHRVDTMTVWGMNGSNVLEIPIIDLHHSVLSKMQHLRKAWLAWKNPRSWGLWGAHPDQINEAPSCVDLAAFQALTLSNFGLWWHTLKGPSMMYRRRYCYEKFHW